MKNKPIFFLTNFYSRKLKFLELITSFHEKKKKRELSELISFDNIPPKEVSKVQL